MGDRQLISAGELRAQLGKDNLRILDCRFDLADIHAARKDYENAHIQGAVYVDLNDDLAAPPAPDTGRHPLPAVESVAARFGKLGVDSATRVIVYDGSNGAMAARAWWMLRWLGHDNVQLLDGGFAAWSAAQYPTTSGRESVEPKRFIPAARNELIVTTDELEKARELVGDLNLLDARDGKRFRGEVEPIDRVAGHIPGARNMPFQDSVDGNGLWKSRDTRRSQWAAKLNNNPTAASIAMCGSGVTACHLILSAVDAGIREPRLYVGSWSEWITDPSRPIGLEEA